MTVREKFDQFDKEKEEKEDEEDYEQLAKIDEAEEQVTLYKCSDWLPLEFLTSPIIKLNLFILLQNKSW